MIETSSGWKELLFESSSDRWLEETSFTKTSRDGGLVQEVHGRDPQPQIWDEMIKARDGEGCGAGVEMWYKEAEQGSDWVKVKGQYNSSFEENDDDENDDDGDDDDKDISRPAIRVRVRRGDDADYTQDGHKNLDPESYEVKKGLYKMFEKKTWPQIKKELFIPGAENDPTAQL